MSPPDLVSIIVRTQGRRPRLLARALASLAAQTWTSLEVIVVEDGADTLGPVLAATTPGDGHALVHHPIASSGRSEAGNAGLAQARGVFIGFLDEDDELYPDHVERLATALAGRPDIAIAYARALEFSCKGLAQDAAQDPRAIGLVGDVPFSRMRMWLRNTIPIQAAMFRRTLYEAHGGFDVSLDTLEDWDLWLRYTAAGDALALASVTSFYRMPAEKAALRARARTHETGRAKVCAKHRGLTASLRFEEVNALPERVRSELHFRPALAIAWRAFWRRLGQATARSRGQDST